MLVGLLLAGAFARRPAASAVLYAADLLGAAAGSLLVLPLIAWAGATAAILWLALLASAVAFATNWTARDRRWTRHAGAFAALIAVLLVLSQGMGLLRLDLANLRGAAPDKTMLMVLHDPGWTWSKQPTPTPS